MELRLSDGVSPADGSRHRGHRRYGRRPGDPHPDGGSEGTGSVETLVLQPQSEFCQSPGLPGENEYRIEEEHMLCEDGKYYAMMRVRRTKIYGDPGASGSDGRRESRFSEKRSGEGTGRHSCSKRKVGLKNE